MHKPLLPKRKNIRLSGYNYSLEGCYFVTIVVQKRLCLFGDVVDGLMNLNAAGNMVSMAMMELEERFPGVKIPYSVVMPNHVHFIVYLPGDIRLNNVVSSFKGYTTHLYSELLKEGARPYLGKLWQRNYYEHIIRSSRSYDFISHYIIVNPERWNKDTLNTHHDPDPDNIMKTVLDIP